jgi:hypothetical protein
MRGTGATLGFVLLLTAAAWAATPLGTAFMYQGRLTDGNAPATGVYDLYVLLYDAETGGAQMGAVAVEDVTVTNGVFTVMLDFGPVAFTGNRCWLHIGVRPGNSTDMFTSLSPRQEVTPTPYALFATTASTALSARALAIPGGQLRLQGSDEDPSIVGGSTVNSVVPGLVGGTVSGGGAANFNGTPRPNTVTDDFGTVAGGLGNQAGNGLLVGGDIATVGGGYLNVAKGDRATVGGGEENLASGAYATVPGGYLNTASGAYSFAAGKAARAQHPGSFVWADSASGAGGFVSNRDNSFLIRAAGGMGVQGQASFGAVGPNAGYEPVEVQGEYAGISLHDRVGGAVQRWIIYARNPQQGAAAGGQNLYFQTDNTKPGPGTGFNNKFTIGANGDVTALGAVSAGGTVAVGALGTAGSTSVCRNSLGQLATCSSSLRYKRAIEPLELGLDAIARLRPVTFDWQDSGAHDLGFVAEDVDALTPLLTTRNADGQVEGVKYDRITAVLVKAVQEQQAALQREVCDRDATIAAQATLIESLERRLAAVESLLRPSATQAALAK